MNSFHLFENDKFAFCSNDFIIEQNLRASPEFISTVIVTDEFQPSTTHGAAERFDASDIAQSLNAESTDGSLATAG